MNGEAEAAPTADRAAEGRQRSTIGFPYMDLASAIDLAEAIFKNVAAGQCDDDQLAAWSGQSSKSSTFRVQVYAARMFGILQGDPSHHSLTDLGLSVVDQLRTREAKVRSFLTVPLYGAIFERFKGGVLPPAAALEREIVALGVAPKQKERARQVFERSADQAGFFEHGRDRLVQPGVAAGAYQAPPGDVVKDTGGSGGGGGGGNGGGDGGQDPLIAALIQKLPRPDPGKPWALAERVAWLKMTAMAFQMAYGAVAEIEIKAPSTTA